MDQVLSGDNTRKAEYYETLGCDRASTIEQITAEYRARVKSLHPDKLLDESDQDKKDQYLRLQTAYSTLSDPEERKCYDAWLECLLPFSYEEFKRNKDAVKVSMHWVTPKQTPMLSDSEESEKARLQEHKDYMAKTSARWEADRYHSDAVRKFRNYEI
ncbi:unnamed protein product [Cylicostephanus goldi]|uniref:J domain-containing protein n=1 Tax=Cylicostephanus goldi TaxID=71465 RepID=A0A3P6QM38_CYLGO|nr:unnamed protein product [Cylicostephanus goldi]